MSKNCEIQLQGFLNCEGEQRDKKCCCRLLGWEKVPCDAEPDDLIALLQSLPPYSEVTQVVNFGNDGWVVIYNYPRPGDCDDTTTPPGTGG